VAAVVRKLEEHGAMENTIVVNAGASDSAALQYIAPYYIGWYECRYIATLGFNNWQCG
jgi:F0F1-type ATP synthase alpha subunit